MIFRAYDDAVAYRFFTKRKDTLIIKNEEANFNFTDDYPSFIPIQWDYRDGQNFNSSFEALYHEIRLSAFPKDSLAFLPLLVEAGEKKCVVLEADLEDYPGMYLDLHRYGQGRRASLPLVPVEAHTVGIDYLRPGGKTISQRPSVRATFRGALWSSANRIRISLNQDIVQKAGFSLPG